MKKYFVVGNKASKSMSPVIFNHWFKRYKINATYGYLELNNNNFDKKIKEIMSDKKVGGLNITIPFKKRIMSHINFFDKHSKKIKAVNCVVTSPKTKGINTDWEGYYKTLPKIKNLKNKKILLIGYGGAALAIHYVLTNKGFKNITVINRTKKKLNFISGTKFTKSQSQLNKHLGTADIIINTTPLNPISSKSKNLVNTNTLLSDIVYKPKETKFLSKFPNNKKIYGISMLIEQAVPCFKIWFGFKPNIDKGLFKALDKHLK